MPRDSDYLISEVLELGKDAIRKGTDPSKWYGLSMRALKNACDAKDIDIALALEVLIYQSFIREYESEEAVYEFCKTVSPWMEGLAEKVEPSKGDGIGFVLPSGSYLANAEVLISVLRKVNNGTVFILGNASVRLRQELTGIDFVESGKGLGNKARIDWLYEEIKKRWIGTIVWVSGQALVHYAFAKRIASKQMYWTLRYHGITSNHVDCLITSSFPRDQEKVEINGRTWVCSPIPWPEKVKRGDEEKINKLKEVTRGYFLMGVVAREEKMTPEYLKAVGHILTECPTAAFLFTSAKPYPLADEILGKFKGRVGNLGWVNPVDTIPAFDLFLDTYPLGCGLTSMVAMDVEVPIVYMKGSMGSCGLSGGGAEDQYSYIRQAVLMYQSDGIRKIRTENQTLLANLNHGRAKRDAEQLFRVING